MNDNTVWILLATTIAASLGLLLGVILGDEVRRRNNAETRIEEMNERLEKISFKAMPPEAQLKKMAIVLNDAHKKITAVTKALAKPAH
jgi:hypothetical protein